MSYVTRYNIDANLWEMGYFTGARFVIVCRYPNV